LAAKVDGSIVSLGNGAGFAHLAIACPLVLAKHQGAKSSQSSFKHSKKRSDISGSALALLNITEIRGDRGLRYQTDLTAKGPSRMHVNGGPRLLVA
jgi:hypothetical protein